MPDRAAVTSAEFIRNIGYWQNEALRRPIEITHHGRVRLVLTAPEEFKNERRDAASEEALKVLRADASAVLDNLQEGYIHFDADLRVRSTNTVCEVFLGRSREDLVGASALEIMPQPLGAIVTDRLQRVIKSRQVELLEIGVIDGRYIAMRVFPLTQGAAVLFANTTARHEQRAQIEDCVALEAATRLHPTAISLKLDSRARIETIDEAFSTRSGFRLEDLTGHRFVDLVVGVQRREVADMIEQVLAGGGPNWSTVVLLGRRGEELPCIFSTAPIVTDFVVRGLSSLLVMNDNVPRAAA